MDEIECNREINVEARSKENMREANPMGLVLGSLGLLMKTISYLLSDFSGCTT